MKKFIFLAVLFVLGCGPSKSEQAKSQVETIVRKPFTETAFKDDGKTGDVDPWGHEIVWEVNVGKYWFGGEPYSGYTIIVRSAGCDGLMYTRDDIIAFNRLKGVEADKVVESVARAVARGKVQGIKEGILGKKE